MNTRRKRTILSEYLSDQEEILLLRQVFYYKTVCLRISNAVMAMTKIKLGEDALSGLHFHIVIHH